jgi:hypothetical protein
VHHILLSVPSRLEEEYRRPLLTFQSTEASEELLLRKRASLAESLLKSTKSMCRQFCFHLYWHLSRLARIFLLFHFTSLLHPTCRGATTHFAPEVHSLRHRARVPALLCSLYTKYK